MTNHGPNRIFLRTALDRAMPLVPVMVIPHVSLIQLIGIAAFVVLRGGWRNLQGYALAIAIAITIALALALCCAVYLVAQSYVDRPEIVGSGVLDQWVRDVYSADRPYDDFPSTHTCLAALIAVYCRRAMPRLGAVISGWCVLIVASTVLIHQHYVADIAGGLLVAWIAVTVADRMVRAIAPTTASAAARTRAPAS